MSAPRVRALTCRDDRLVPVEPGENPPVVVLEVSGAVHYAAVDPLLEDMGRQLPPAAKLVIVDLSHAHDRTAGVNGFLAAECAQLALMPAVEWTRGTKPLSASSTRCRTYGP